MKKSYVIVFITLTLGLTAVIGVSCSYTSGENETTQATQVIPDSLMKVFKNSCMACHSDEGSGMAKSIVNFSQWDKYPVAKQASKAQAICKEIADGSMPPASYKSANPDKVPTKAEEKMICTWAEKLNAK